MVITDESVMKMCTKTDFSCDKDLKEKYHKLTVERDSRALHNVKGFR